MIDPWARNPDEPPRREDYNTTSQYEMALHRWQWERDEELRRRRYEQQQHADALQARYEFEEYRRNFDREITAAEQAELDTIDAQVEQVQQETRGRYSADLIEHPQQQADVNAPTSPAEPKRSVWGYVWRWALAGIVAAAFLVGGISSVTGTNVGSGGSAEAVGNAIAFISTVAGGVYGYQKGRKVQRTYSAELASYRRELRGWEAQRAKVAAHNRREKERVQTRRAELSAEIAELTAELRDRRAVIEGAVDGRLRAGGLQTY